MGGQVKKIQTYRLAGLLPLLFKQPVSKLDVIPVALCASCPEVDLSKRFHFGAIWCAIFYLFTVFQAQAQIKDANHDALIAKLNSNTVTIVSGTPNGTYLAVAYDMAAVLDNGDKLRILPVIGMGGVQNVRDVLYLKGVDLGITQSDTLRYFEQTGELGKNLKSKLRYVAKLMNSELHILARPEINSIEELKGKTVNFSDAGSSTDLSARLIFKYLGIDAQEVNMGQADAVERMRRGELAATVFCVGKPASVFAKMKNDAGFKFLSMPYAPVLQKDYLPAEITNADYPNIVPKGTSVDTIAVATILAGFNWPANSDRYRRIALFIDALFKNIEKFQHEPRHPKWKEINLLADVPGWTRFTAAQQWVDKNRTPTKPIGN